MSTENQSINYSNPYRLNLSDFDTSKWHGFHKLAEAERLAALSFKNQPTSRYALNLGNFVSAINGELAER